ncbi:uncharacterized protein BDW47DRAFT_123456 [Aspergillus candidus]|uniref:Uncharacterized protein n=1 Tax=Aspergillus candidus TaxID=41067 RepID=A0A2I2FII9_ASPCN|nr:hypothetical protein BDW47DRAFT_123456 [Aspergillus candidus]PLB40433.1 hypothetical protein BDW47DRAFT_123456 [Aspergillus candidus]
MSRHKNTYRHGSYVSFTGGGSGKVPMVFAVDVRENRRQRAQMGQWETPSYEAAIAFTEHRTLDLITGIMENADATILSAGSVMSPAEVTKAMRDYHVNVLTGDGSRIAQVVCHIASLPRAERAHHPLQDHLHLGAAHSSDSAATDFLIDTRDIHIEILPPSAASTGNCSCDGVLSLPDGEMGLIVQASLQRLHNPLVRYVTGDIGSLHTVPDHVATQIPASERKHLRWDMMYFDVDKVEAIFEAPECGILQWQVILGGADDGSPVATLEELVDRLRGFWSVLPENEHLVRIVFVKGLAEFQTSATAGKVIRFVDRWH